MRGALVAGCCVFALPVAGAPVAPVGGALMAPVGGAPVAPVGRVAAAVISCDEGLLVWVNNLGVVFRGCVNKLGFSPLLFPLNAKNEWPPITAMTTFILSIIENCLYNNAKTMGGFHFCWWSQGWKS